MTAASARAHVSIFVCTSCKGPLLGLRSGIAIPPGAKWIGGIDGLDVCAAPPVGQPAAAPSRAPGTSVDPFEGVTTEPVAGEPRVVVCRDCLAKALGFVTDKQAVELEAGYERYQTDLWKDKGPGSGRR